MVRISKLVNKLLKSRTGYEVKSAAYLESFEFSRHVAKLFRMCDIRCVLDVGANDGDYTEWLRREVGYKGLVVSFEPVRELVEQLRAKARHDPKWIVHDFALGSSNTRSQINVMQGHTFSSFLTPDHSTVTEFGDKNVVKHVEEVEVRTLDSVIGMLREQHQIENLYLKIDTQGFDLEVVRGAAGTLPEVRALQTEVATRTIYREMPTIHDMLTELGRHGFDVTGLFPVVRDSLLRVVEFDCVMINRRLAGDSD